MTNIPLLTACLPTGVLLRIARRVPDAHAALNGFIVRVALPALILGQIHGLRLATNLLWPVSIPWLLFALSAVAFTMLARVLRLPSATTGALIMTAGLTSTSFVGLPMIEAYGAQGLPTGIFAGQLGTCLVLSTAGAIIACLFSAGTASRRESLLRVLTFPPLAALVLAILLAPVEHPAWLAELLSRLGGTVAPLALGSVGLQLRLDRLRGRLPPGLSLGVKPMLAPLLLVRLHAGLPSRHGEAA
jgi:predicted permease